MRGHWGRLVLAVVALFAVLRPALFVDDGSTSGPASDPASITRYDAELTVARNGDLSVVETVVTAMPPGRHGIFRYWDVVDPGDPHVRLLPHDIAVTRDGLEETVALSWEDHRRFRVAKIGDAAITLGSGAHTYVLRYRIDGALSDDGSRDARFRWNLVPGGWEMAIAESRLTVHLPADSTGRLRCAVGLGETGGCRVQGTGTRDLTVSTGAIPPRTPVTVETHVAVPPPGRDGLPWSIRLDPVLGRSTVLLGVLVVLALLGLVVGWALARRSREEDPGFPLVYAPPEGLGPAQAGYVVEESVPSSAMTATLLYQAERGLTRITRTSEDDWTVEGTGTPEQWAATDPATRALGESMNVTTPGYHFLADGTAPSGQGLIAAKASLEGAITSWASKQGVLRSSVPEAIGKVLVVVAVLLGFVLAVPDPFDLTAVALPPLGFALGGLPLLRRGATTRRTPAGREMWSRAGGFKRILSTPSSEQRFEFSAQRDLYTAFVPWAVAFGCAEAWAAKYHAETGEPAPTPVWMHGFVGTPGTYGSNPTAFVDSFESSLSSSISAYQATQSSSSSGGGGGGGGGFSGGGGGGGGGGGSW